MAVTIHVPDREIVPVYISTEKVKLLASEMKELHRELQRRNMRLATPEEVAMQYSDREGSVFRHSLYVKGWSLTSDVGLERYGYQKLNGNKDVFSGTTWEEFVNLPAEGKAFCYPGDRQVVVSNALLEGSQLCLVFRADITKPREVHYVYTMTAQRSAGAAAAIAALKRRI